MVQMSAYFRFYWMEIHEENASEKSPGVVDADDGHSRRNEFIFSISGSSGVLSVRRFPKGVEKTEINLLDEF